jgi:putative NIF3 family GTP cyclohydrolase 1 type 2
MPTARQIAKVFEEIAPLQTGIAGDELGFVFGDPQSDIRGVACTWNVHATSIQTCVKQNLDMIICHESIWLQPQTSPWYQGPGEVDIFSNNLRRKLIEQHNLVVYRSHSNWDALANEGVPDQAVAALRLPGLRMIAKQKFFSVMELDESKTIQELRHHVEEGLQFPYCRIFGDPSKRVSRFAFLIGGFGENQLHMPQAAREMGAEAIIIGEMSEFIVIACLEMGMPVIESLHSASEIPAIKRQAAILGERLPGIPVKYVPSGAMVF